MKKILLALALCLLPTLVSAQCSGIFTAGNVCGTVAGGPPKQTPITSFAPFASASANTVFAGPTSGGAAAPAFRSLVGADLPLPTAITLGAVFSKTPTASNWLRSLGTDGIFTISQPAFTDISGSATLAQLPTEGADTVLGNFTGGTAVPNTTSVPNCAGALNYSTSTHTFSCNTSSVPSATDEIANCSLAGSVSGNALTIALKDQTGADPSANSACQISFRSATAATGTYTTVSVTSALSFSTGTSGSTFGSSNSIPFRLWITAWNNAGTIVLGVSSQSNATNVFPINEGATESSTACNACTNAATTGTYYTTAAQTSIAKRIIGYMDWGSGLATAGTWASGPTTIQMFGAGIKRPGDTVQTVYSNTTSSGTVSNTAFTAISPSPTITLTKTSAINPIRVNWSGTLQTINGVASVVRVVRGLTVQVGNPTSTGGGSIAVNEFPIGQQAWDPPATPTGVTYTFQAKSSSGTVTFPSSSTGAQMTLDEIMG